VKHLALTFVLMLSSGAFADDAYPTSDTASNNFDGVSFCRLLKVHHDVLLTQRNMAINSLLLTMEVLAALDVEQEKIGSLISSRPVESIQSDIEEWDKNSQELENVIGDYCD